MAEPDYEYGQYAPKSGERSFSSAMFGFNKDEVLDYLEEISEENYRRQEDAERHIQELSQRIRQLENRPATVVTETVTDSETEAKLQAIAQDLEIAHAATQQSEEELQQNREMLYNIQQENAWLREEFGKYEQAYGQLSQQLELATQGQWQGPSPEMQEMQMQLQQANAHIQDLSTQLVQTQQELANFQNGYPQDEATFNAQQAASAIIAEANHEADRIRDEATAEKERLHRQIRTSAGGLAESIYTLRAELADVEGDVSGILESVQLTLTDVMAALARTEQNLSTFGNQVDRFPHSSPPVKSQKAALQFSEEPTYAGIPGTMPAGRGNMNSGLQPVSPSATRPAPSATRKRRTAGPAFQPTYSTSATAVGSGSWPQAEDAYAANMTITNNERVREVSDSLADTLRQMVD